jgi:hypothetical protein
LCNGSALSIPLGIRLEIVLISNASVSRMSRIGDKMGLFGCFFLASEIVVITYA